MTIAPCSHPGCSCSVVPARLFCSDSCRRAADLPPELAHGCSCRHAQCVGSAARRHELETGVFADEPRVGGPLRDGHELGR
jgi:hypothetical protein